MFTKLILDNNFATLVNLSFMNSTNLSTFKRITSGFVLVIFTILPILVIACFWPNELPAPGKMGNYSYHGFGVKLVPNSFPGEVIYLNSLLFILVASAGFLGSMIHISASFTAFVGAGKFDHKWLLWYVVKPVSAAGLAVIVYFSFRAGLLNGSGENSASINLYGMMSFAVLTGLFTDVATQKLEEVAKVIFKPKDDRPDKLGGVPSISNISPDNLRRGETNSVVIEGENLDDKSIQIFVGGVSIEDIKRTKCKISFQYNVPANLPDAVEIKVTHHDPAKSLFARTIAVV